MAVWFGLTNMPSLTKLSPINPLHHPATANTSSTSACAVVPDTELLIGFFIISSIDLILPRPPLSSDFELSFVRWSAKERNQLPSLDLGPLTSRFTAPSFTQEPIWVPLLLLVSLFSQRSEWSKILDVSSVSDGTGVEQGSSLLGLESEANAQAYDIVKKVGTPMGIIESAISALVWLFLASRLLPRVAGNAEGGIFFLISFFPPGIFFF